MKKCVFILLGFVFNFFLNLSGSAASLYDLPSTWLDTNGKETKVGINSGSYSLIAMVYTGCAHACPMIISKVESILKDLDHQGFKDIKVVLASLDVKKDRPDRLKKYQESRKLDFNQWKFLSPQKEAHVRELAVALGVSYKDLGNGDFSHSNLIALLDPKGEVLASIDNLNASSDVFVAALKKASHSSIK